MLLLVNLFLLFFFSAIDNYRCLAINYIYPLLITFGRLFIQRFDCELMFPSLFRVLVMLSPISSCFFIMKEFFN